MPELTVHISNASSTNDAPSDQTFQYWATLFSDRIDGNRSVSLRLVDDAEMTSLNESYRGKHGPTNVLSFVADHHLLASQNDPESLQIKEFLGDVVICSEQVQRESEQQNKPLENHWAHLFIHGVLHLLGYDHEQAKDAAEMESLETELLSLLNIAAPY